MHKQVILRIWYRDYLSQICESNIISQAIYYLCPNISIAYKGTGLRHYSEHIVSHANTFSPHTFNHSTLQVNI